MPEPEHTSTILPAVTSNTGNRPMLEPLLLTPRDAAKALSVCERTLYGLTMPRGDIPVIRVRNLVRYNVSDLREWARKKSLENS